MKRVYVAGCCDDHHKWVRLSSILYKNGFIPFSPFSDPLFLINYYNWEWEIPRKTKKFLKCFLSNIDIVYLTYQDEPRSWVDVELEIAHELNIPVLKNFYSVKAYDLVHSNFNELEEILSSFYHKTITTFKNSTSYLEKKLHERMVLLKKSTVCCIKIEYEDDEKIEWKIF